MSRIDIVRYDPSLRETVLDLQTHHWGRNRAQNAAQLDWKYFRGPCAEKSRIYVALEKGRAVAMRGFAGSRWESGAPAQVVTLLSAGDLVIEPTLRNRGLFTRLMQVAVAEINGECPYLLSLSAGNATRLGSLTMGWREAGPISRLSMGKIVSASTGWSVLKQWFRSTTTSFDRIDRRAGRRRTLGRDIVLSQSPRPAAMAALIRRLGSDGRIRHVRDEGYFAWRFEQPRGLYRFLFSGERDLDGYLVLQTKALVPGSAVSIVDCEPPAGPVARALLQAALEPADLGRVRMWIPGMSADAIQTAQRLNMRPVPIKSFAEPFQSFLIRPATLAVPPRPWLLAGLDVLDLANWDLRQLYSDGF